MQEGNVAAVILAVSTPPIIQHRSNQECFQQASGLSCLLPATQRSEEEKLAGMIFEHDQENISPQQQEQQHRRYTAPLSGRGRVLGGVRKSLAAVDDSAAVGTTQRVSDTGSCRSRASAARFSAAGVRSRCGSHDGLPRPAYMQSTASMRAKEASAQQMLRERKSYLQQRSRHWA